MLGGSAAADASASTSSSSAGRNKATAVEFSSFDDKDNERVVLLSENEAGQPAQGTGKDAASAQSARARSATRGPASKAREMGGYREGGRLGGRAP